MIVITEYILQSLGNRAWGTGGGVQKDSYPFPKHRGLILD